MADKDDGPGQLTPLARLALAYAPKSAREDWLSLLLLDCRLSSVVRTAREPMLAQMRLAWWRDRLGGDPATWPKGEPLLSRLSTWGPLAHGLSPLVDGWEALLGDDPSLAEFAEGRAAAMRNLALRLGSDEDAAEASGRRWALADLALHVSDPAEKAQARVLLAEAPPVQGLPGPLRPLAVMTGLSERAVRRGEGEALSGPAALFAAIRLGLVGR